MNTRSKDIARDEKLQVSLTKLEMEALKTLAAKSDLRITDYVRFLIRYVAISANVEPFNDMNFLIPKNHTCDNKHSN